MHHILQIQEIFIFMMMTAYIVLFKMQLLRQPETSPAKFFTKASFLSKDSALMKVNTSRGFFLSPNSICSLLIIQMVQC